MCSKLKWTALLFLSLIVSCTSYRKVQKIRSGEFGLGLSVANEKPVASEKEPVTDGILTSVSDNQYIMNAIRDADTGEMVATDVISASRVVARFRNVAERSGYVSVGFDIVVPQEIYDSKWQLRIHPCMIIKGRREPLESVYVTGQKYRDEQMRGYERYRKFLSSIVTDSTEFINVKQLELFLSRNFPETYAMKSDSSLVSESLAENLFGVTQSEALLHYTDKFSQRQNDKRKARCKSVFKRLVRSPIVDDGIRLDTVLCSDNGEFVYRYIHTFRSEPGLRKVVISLMGGLFDSDAEVAPMSFPEDITFYISSLSSLVDERQAKIVTGNSGLSYELDTLYMSGVRAPKELDYKKAVSILKPYNDYNAALALISADYNHSALEVLRHLDESNPKVCYLKAIVLSRLDEIDEALQYFILSLHYDPSLLFRANLDPEMFRVVTKYKSINQNKDEF